MVLDGKSLQVYPVNGGVPEGSIHFSLFLLYFNELPDDVICNIAICVDDTALYSRHLILAKTTIGFRTWIWSTRHCELGTKWLVDFNAGKAQLVSFDWSNNTGAINLKIDGPTLEKWSFKMLGLTFSSYLDLCSYIIPIAKTALRKLESRFVLWSLFLLRLLCISINLSWR